MTYDMDSSHVIVTKYKIYTIGGARSGGIHSMICNANFSGGSNDYHDYIKNTFAPTLTGFFQLPNLTHKGMTGYEVFLVKA